MMAVGQSDGALPGAVELLAQWVGIGMPLVEITHHGYRIGLWGKADEIDRLKGLLRLQAPERWNVVHQTRMHRHAHGTARRDTRHVEEALTACQGTPKEPVPGQLPAEIEIKLGASSEHLIQKGDGESFFAWARPDFACHGFDLRVTHTPKSNAKARAEFRPLGEVPVSACPFFR